MAGKSESVESHPAGEWDTPFRNSPGSAEGEFSRVGANPVLADVSALSFTETARTPRDGYTDRDQSKFPTRDAHGKQA